MITAESAAATLGVTRATLYAYVSRGLLHAAADPNDPRRRLYDAGEIARLARGKVRGRKAAEIAAGALDWGQPALSSGITLIEGNRLFFRGRDAARLAAQASVEDVARLLWECGDDPFDDTPPPIVEPAATLMRALAGASPVDRCLALLPLVGAGTMTWQRERRRLWREAALLLRVVAAVATGTMPDDAPIHRHVARAWRKDERAAQLIRAALILCADHELNASAFAVRVVASTGASLAACVSAGLSALSGPQHGGTTSLVEILFDEVERLGNATRVVQERLRRGDRLPGFDHPLYRDGDPRALALLPLLRPDPARDALRDAMDAIGGKLPNIDFALVSLRRALGLAPGSALALFAIGRTVGWIAHALEQQAEGKLIRPRARYVGAAPEA
jgi:citrate synthase